MWSYWHTEAIAAFFTRTGQSMSGLQSFGRDLSVSMAQATGGDMTLMITAYVAVTLGIVAAGGMMTLRFVRGR